MTQSICSLIFHAVKEFEKPRANENWSKVIGNVALGQAIP